MYKSILAQYRAPVYVISIGNMIVGGSGKTPFTIYLAELLSNQGLQIGVSHRGYKSKLENKVTVISDQHGLLPIADEAGDEAWLIAKRLVGIPVVVGKDRTKAIQLLCKTFPDLDVVILDDSFQHLKVKHDLDFVIINEWLRFGNGFVLPSGILREPMTALNNADILIINRINETGEIDKKLCHQLKPYTQPLFQGRYETIQVYDFIGNEIAVDKIVGDRVLMISGVGNPNGFDASVRALKLNIIGGILFQDHYEYADKAQRERILKSLHEKEAKWIITTEKDYAKLRHYPEFADFLLILKISFILDDSEKALTGLIQSFIKV